MDTEQRRISSDGGRGMLDGWEALTLTSQHKFESEM
jgi:hypothetical protein